MIYKTAPAGVLLVLVGLLRPVAAQDFRSQFEAQSAVSLAILGRMNLCVEMGRFAGIAEQQKSAGVSSAEFLSVLDKAAEALPVKLSGQLLNVVATGVFSRPLSPGTAVGEVTLACETQLAEQIAVKSAAAVAESEREALKFVMSDKYVPPGAARANGK